MKSDDLPAVRHSPQNVRVHLDYLDGIRGLAAAFVMAHHLGHAYTKVPLPGLLGLTTNWLLYGHLCVDVFIVLSGFCLMLPVARSRKLRGGWRTFFKGRARRILPPLYVAMALAVGIMVIRHIPISMSECVVNLLLLQDVFVNQNTFDGPLWSVALECKIYLLFPTLVWLWLRAGRAAVLLTATAISAVVYVILAWSGRCDDMIFMRCPWYVLLFAMGMVASDLAVHHEQITSKWQLQLLLAIAFISLGATLHAWPVGAAGSDSIYLQHLPVIDTAAGLFTALLLTVLGAEALQKKRSFTIEILAWRPLVFLGSFAYSLYLVHFILIYYFKKLMIVHLPFHPAYIVIPLDMIIVCCLSYLFHLVIERPFMSKHPPKTERQAEVAAIISPAP